MEHDNLPSRRAAVRTALVLSAGTVAGVAGVSPVPLTATAGEPPLQEGDQKAIQELIAKVPQLTLSQESDGPQEGREEEWRTVRPLQSFSAHGLSKGPLWPGAIIKGSSLARFQLDDFIVSDRLPGDLIIKTVVAQGAKKDEARKVVTPSRRIENPTAAVVEKAIRELFAELPAAQPPAQTSADFRLSYSLNHALLKLRVSAKFLGNGFALDHSTVSSRQQSIAVVRLFQPFATLIFKPLDTPPAGFFGKTMKLDTVAKVVEKNNPLLYISEVVYGRELFFTLESSESLDSMESEVSSTFGLGPVSVEASAATKRKDVLTKYHARILACGGPAFFKKNGGAESKDAVNQWIAEGAELTPESPSEVLCFEARYLRDNELVRISDLATYRIRKPIIVQAVWSSGGGGAEPDEKFKFVDSDKEIVPLGAKVTGVKGYLLNDGKRILGLQLTYRIGSDVMTTPLRGAKSDKSFEYKLKDGEWLVGISGRNGAEVDSIQFHTNLGRTERFGAPEANGNECYHLTPKEDLRGWPHIPGNEKNALQCRRAEVPAKTEIVGFCGYAKPDTLLRIGIVVRTKE